LRVSYRPRGSVSALARQYFHYGQWRREVMRRHPDTVNLRYLAPPSAVAALTLGLAAAVAGIWVPVLLWGLAVPAGYVTAVLLATLFTRRLPARARLWLPVVFATMHMSWGVGFLRQAVQRSRFAVT
jgi:hypothetical protein